MDKPPVYIVLVSLHGLIRGQDLELGRDADTGGQTKYVVELARDLAADERVGRVDLLTRQIVDSKVSPDYAVVEEELADGAAIIRIPFGPKRYVRKELLWPWLGQFVDGAIKHFHNVGTAPDVIHAHYADAGWVGSDLASMLSVPLIFTGHSLGQEKRRSLLDSGVKAETIESRFNLSRRIEAEEKALSNAALVIASTSQEIENQYSLYDHYRKSRTAVVPPGVDLSMFRPPNRFGPRAPIYERISRFLADPKKPWILALSRPDERKNLHTLVEAYGGSPTLRSLANLVVVAGSRDEIQAMDRGPKGVLNDLLLRIDSHDLYGNVAYPKQHDPDEVPEIYREAARSRGVFVNPALTEPFGLTLLEAAASGLPVVATDDGGPRDIISRCQNGFLVDPLSPDDIAAKLQEVLAERTRWRRFSASGLRAVNRYYTWESHVKQYLREVVKVLGRPRRTRRVVEKAKLPAVDRIFVSDIDNTLLGEDPEALRALMEKLRSEGQRCAFAVATGRRIQSAVKVLRNNNVVEPDFWITSVGSEIHYGRQLVSDEEWRHNIDYRWDAAAIREALRGEPGLKLQARGDQRPHKVSFYIDPAKAPSLRELQLKLRQLGLRGKTIFSHGQYLDILPVRASKGLAIRYVAHRWGIPMDRVMVAGDSGNDEEMLNGLGLGVVVANYSEELEKLRGNKHTYFSSREEAWGIIEGIEHYDFFGAIRRDE